MTMRSVLSVLMIVGLLAPAPLYAQGSQDKKPGTQGKPDLMPSPPGIDPNTAPGSAPLEQPDYSWLPKLEDPPYPGGAVIDSIPPDAIALTRDETVKEALAGNLDIAVGRYNPQIALELATVQRSVFDPTAFGTVYNSHSQDSRTQFFGALPITFANNSDGDGFTASWFDPLTFGGSYRVDYNADNSWTHIRQDNVNLGSTLMTDEKVRTNGYTLTYNQPLLRGLGRQVNLWQYTVAQNNLAISEAQFRQTALDTVATAEKAYWDLNFSILQLRTARFALKVAQDFLEQNKVKVRVGTLAPIEITQAEAQVADRDETVILAEANLRASVDAIRKAVGLRKDSPDWARPVRPSEGLQVKDFAPSEEESYAVALENRPDIEQAKKLIENNNTELKARQNLRRWGLDFSGTYGDLLDGEQHIQGSPRPDQIDTSNWRAQLALTVPIGNRNALANYTRAQASLAQTQFLMQQAEQVARLDVRQQVRQVDTTLKRVRAANVNVRLQVEKLRAEQKKFENGMSTSFQVLSFQNDLFDAKSRENLAIADYNKALVDLSHSQGTLLVERGILVQPMAPGDAAVRQSAALRYLWNAPQDQWSDPGLRLAETASEAVHLPADFDWASLKRTP
jgi:outer membrane protein TolC